MRCVGSADGSCIFSLHSMTCHSISAHSRRCVLHPSGQFSRSASCQYAKGLARLDPAADTKLFDWLCHCAHPVSELFAADIIRLSVGCSIFAANDDFTAGFGRDQSAGITANHLAGWQSECVCGRADSLRRAAAAEFRIGSLFSAFVQFMHHVIFEFWTFVFKSNSELATLVCCVFSLCHVSNVQICLKTTSPSVPADCEAYDGGSLKLGLVPLFQNFLQYARSQQNSVQTLLSTFNQVHSTRANFHSNMATPRRH